MVPFPVLSPDICSPQALEDVYDLNIDEENHLGSGAFSTVYLVKDRETGQKKAVKRIAKRLMQTKRDGVRVIDLSPIEEEVKLQRECCATSKNIVQVFNVFDSGQTVDIVLEPMLKEDLFDAIEKVYYPEAGDMGECKYSEAEASKIARQLVSAVWACHKHSVCHRDLKPENILVHEYHPLGPIVKLCDFGLATKLESGQFLTEACGTPEYVAPEVVSKKVQNLPSYDFAADVWSIGVILFVLLSGEQPFRSDSGDGNATREVLDKVRGHRSLSRIFNQPDDSYGANIWKDMSDDVKQLLDKQLLNRDPDKRLTAKDLYQHPWITGELASTKAIPNSLMPLHKAWLKRKFRVAIFAMMATNRIKNFVSNLRAEKIVATLEVTAARCHALLDAFRLASPMTLEEALVDRETFIEMLKSHAIAPGEEEKHFQLFSTDSFGGGKVQINYREYCVGLGWRTASCERDKLILLFAAFDIDGNKMIDHDEFVVMMTALSSRVGASGLPPQRNTIASTSLLFKEIDANGDGLVDEQEFLSWVSGSELVQQYLGQVNIFAAEPKPNVTEATPEPSTTAVSRDSVEVEKAAEKKSQSSCCVVS